MYIAYYDESGDTGHTKFSSPLFVLSCLYLHEKDWKKTKEKLHEFRKTLKGCYNFPLNLEFHFHDFLLNKSPYTNYSFTPEIIVDIVDKYCNLISELDVKIVNIVVIKKRITKTPYPILSNAFKCSIQRIHNDMEKNFSKANFMIITDKGQVPSMVKTARKMVQENLIRSNFSKKFYNKEIALMIEDPFAKDSKQSYFIQAVDMISYITYLYINKNIPNRMPSIIDKDKIIEWMNVLKNSFNVDASKECKYGIVRIPKGRKK
jgi:hypothetical protein